MAGILLLLLLAVPVIELYVFLQVADSIGFLATLGWMVLVAVVGTWLVKREGLSALRRANANVAQGQIPANELIDGLLILFAGALLLTPGFLSDALALALVFPPTRIAVRSVLRRRFAAGPILLTGFPGGFGAGPMGGPFGAPGGSAAGRSDVVDAESWEDDPRPGGPRELG